MAREILDIYENTLQRVAGLACKDERCSVLSPMERARFDRSFYQVWIFHVITSADGWKPFPQASMIASSKREQLLNLIMMIWMVKTMCGRSSLKHLPGERGQLKYCTLLGYIIDLKEKVGGLFTNICRLPLLWAIYDEWQDVLESTLQDRH